MKQTKIRELSSKVHLLLLVFVLLNFIAKTMIGVGLNYELTYFIVLLVYISGTFLFFWSIKPMNKVIIYYSYYIITPVLTLCFWLFGGVFFGLLTSITLYPIYPNEIKAENEKNVIYSKYQGFMGACCCYEVTEKKYWFLEEKKTEINLEQEIDFTNVSVTSTKKIIQLKFPLSKYDEATKRFIKSDSIIEIQTK
ncbi:hypothetical protein [Nonlabens marinus]|uniref:Uncharacterized protein n=1 Tax=Nonlabens marinus S1-08 TaxID=1454201 RepID=W8VQ82_9FLAO|nr:hypothetical protein [Nonlabens marinus]BAO55509.1 hypothetical protein NMS_1500 [Nonlabens marinus S1-08]